MQYMWGLRVLYQTQSNFFSYKKHNRSLLFLILVFSILYVIFYIKPMNLSCIHNIKINKYFSQLFQKNSQL